MNRSRIAVAALAFGCASILAPAAASANPWVDVVASGTLTPLDGTSGNVGQEIIVTGADCVSPEPGAPTYMGEFAAIGVDPLTNPGVHIFETATDELGAFRWDVTIGVDTTSGRYHTRWYCSTAPVTSLDDPAMLWVSPVLWMDISDVPAAPAARMQTVQKASSGAKATPLATRSSTAKLAKQQQRAGTPDRAASVALVADPDALPALDRIGITGPKAAALKAKVDAAYDKDARGLELLKKLAGRNVKAVATIDRLLDQQYVATAQRVLGVKRLSPSTAKALGDRLDAGEIRVNVVEDLALMVRDAAWYNAR
jgi:hypothetical protein